MSPAYLDGVFSAVGHALVVLNLDGRVTDANPKAGSLMRLHRQALNQRTLGELLDDSSQPGPETAGYFRREHLAP